MSSNDSRKLDRATLASITDAVAGVLGIPTDQGHMQIEQFPRETVLKLLLHIDYQQDEIARLMRENKEQRGDF